MTIRFTTSHIPSPLESLRLEKGKTLVSFNTLCITVVDEHNGTSIYGEIAQAFCDAKRKRRENKLGKEIGGKLSGVKSEGQMSRGRNRFPTEFITELGEGFVLI